MGETSRSLHRGRILVVDANEKESAVHPRLRALEDAGHEVKRIGLSNDAVRVVRDYPPHCIVLRVRSVDDDAVRFLGEVRRLDRQVELVLVDEDLEPFEVSGLAERYRVVLPESVEGEKRLEALVEKALGTMNDNFADSRTQPATMANYGIKLVASISSALIGLDGRGNVSLWNNTAENTFGLESSEVLGRPFSRLNIRWADPATMDKIRAAGLVDLPTRLDDVRFYREDSKERILGMTVNPIHGGTPEDKGMLIMARDLSQIRTIESRLSQAKQTARQIDGSVRRIAADLQRIAQLCARAHSGSAEASGERGTQDESVSLETVVELAGRSLKEVEVIARSVESIFDAED